VTKVRLTALDKLIAAENLSTDIPDELPGRPLKFDPIEPWPNSVDGAALLYELSDTIGSYVVLSQSQRDGVALWAVFTHAHDLRDFAPLLIAKSAVKRSGKSRLVEVFERLAPRPLYVAGLTAAFIERAIEDHHCTLLIDEADRLRKGDQATAERIDAQLNRSFKRQGAKVGKNVPLPGGGYAPRLFSTWAPTLIAGIGDQADTAEDRAVIIILKRKLTTEKVKQLRARDGADLAVLGRKIARFVADNENFLRVHEPEPLDVANDRAKDVFEPLLTIAAAAGGSWPRRAREAAKALLDVVEEEDLKIILLGDIRVIFFDAFPPDHHQHSETPEDDEAQRNGWYGPRVTSKGLVEELLKLEERPYGAFGKTQKPLTQNGLARMLKGFGVRPGTIRFGKTAKGYYLRAFEDAFERYLLPIHPPPGRHADTMAAKAGVSADSQPSHQPSHPPTHSDTQPSHPMANHSVTDDAHFEKRLENPQLSRFSPSNSGHCDGVTDETGVYGGTRTSLLSSIARAVVDLAQRHDLKLMLVDGRLAFDERLWRKASPQMLNALCSCESEIAAWLRDELARDDGSAGDDEPHLSPDANRRQNDANDDGSQKPAQLVLEI
jgi:hypothetical protein